MRCSIVVVGDEILAGHVVDANGPYLIERITENGHSVRRLVVIGDDPDQISSELRAEMRVGADVVLVCGGLGPTHDDRTMEGVALALGTKLEPCPPLAARIEATIVRAASEGFSDAAIGASGFRKMALAPVGARFLECSSGVVPAIAVDAGETVVIVLPGPPRELRAVVRDRVEPDYLRGTAERSQSEELTHRFPEASLAALLTDLQRQFPALVIGSYPRRQDALIRIAGNPEDVRVAARIVRDRIAELAETEEGMRLIEFMERRRAERLGVESG